MSNKENVMAAVEHMNGEYIGLEPGQGYLFRFGGAVLALRSTGASRTTHEYIQEIKDLLAFREKQEKGKTMKRNYLNVPGQQVTIEVRGPSGCGKVAVVDVIFAAFTGKGVIIGSKDRDSITLTCPTHAHRQEAYLESLDDQQRETLRGHLDALGFDLEKQV